MSHLNRKEFKLDFIGIGSEKAGTYWIANNLRKHPEVFIPKKKEVFFFNKLDPHFLKYPSYNYGNGIDWYKNQFIKANPTQVIGEYTPTYIYCKESAKRIKEHFQNIKFILTLRDPVKRAFSQYIHDMRIGVMPKKYTFEMAMKKNHTYIEKGFTYKHLKHFVETGKYDISQFIFITTDEIKNNPKNTLKALYDFLEIENKSYTPLDIEKKENPAGRAIFPKLNELMIGTEYKLRGEHYEIARRLAQLLDLREIAIFIRDLNRVNFTEETCPTMNKDTELSLRKIFKQDVNNLSNFVNKDLSNWL